MRFYGSSAQYRVHGRTQKYTTCHTCTQGDFVSTKFIFQSNRTAPLMPFRYFVVHIHMCSKHILKEYYIYFHFILLVFIFIVSMLQKELVHSFIYIWNKLPCIVPLWYTTNEFFSSWGVKLVCFVKQFKWFKNCTLAMSPFLRVSCITYSSTAGELLSH